MGGQHERGFLGVMMMRKTIMMMRVFQTASTPTVGMSSLLDEHISPINHHKSSLIVKRNVQSRQ